MSGNIQNYEDNKQLLLVLLWIDKQMKSAVLRLISYNFPVDLPYVISMSDFLPQALICLILHKDIALECCNWDFGVNNFLLRWRVELLNRTTAFWKQINLCNDESCCFNFMKYRNCVQFFYLSLFDNSPISSYSVLAQPPPPLPFMVKQVRYQVPTCTLYLGIGW